MSLLLISNSTQHGHGYLDHVEAELRSLLAQVRTVLFVPFAMFDRVAYAARTRARLEAMGWEVHALDSESPIHEVERAEAIFVGGGNTFRLLKSLQDAGVIDVICRR